MCNNHTKIGEERGEREEGGEKKKGLIQVTFKHGIFITSSETNDKKSLQ